MAFAHDVDVRASASEPSRKVRSSWRAAEAQLKAKEEAAALGTPREFPFLLG